MLHVLQFLNTKGRICYGLRQQSVPEYQEFYKWAYTVSYECIGDNMPWDYFYFNDPADDATFREKYGAGIYIDEGYS